MKRSIVKVFFVFGTAKINYRIAETLDDNIIVVFFTTKKISQSKTYKLRYKDQYGVYNEKRIKKISDTTEIDGSLSFVEKNINIYVVNTESHIRILESFNTFVAVSCCRDGLVNTYIPLINVLDCKGYIISFDNNKEIAHRAQLASINCHVVAGVAHCYVPHEPTEDNDGDFTLISERSGYLFFPPHCNVFKTFFRVRPSSYVQVYYAKSEDEFNKAIQRKILNVNLLHTLLCLEIKQRYLDKYNEISFGDIPEEEYNGVVTVILTLHNNMYILLFGKDGEYISSCKHAEKFLENVRRYNESPTRGVDFDSDDSLKKAKSHLGFMNDIGISIERYSFLLYRD